MELREAGKWVATSIVTVVVGAAAYSTLKIYMARRRHAHIPGPPTQGLLGFYFGHTFEIVRAKDNQICFLDICDEWQVIFSIYLYSELEGNKFKIDNLIKASAVWQFV